MRHRPLGLTAPLPDAMPSTTPRDLSPLVETASPSRLRAHWQAELIRLREAHWGPLEDADAVRRARHLDAGLPARILASRLRRISSLTVSNSCPLARSSPRVVAAGRGGVPSAA